LLLNSLVKSFGKNPPPHIPNNVTPHLQSYTTPNQFPAQSYVPPSTIAQWSAHGHSSSLPALSQVHPYVPPCYGNKIQGTGSTNLYSPPESIKSEWVTIAICKWYLKLIMSRMHWRNPLTEQVLFGIHTGILSIHFVNGFFCCCCRLKSTSFTCISKAPRWWSRKYATISEALWTSMVSALFTTSTTDAYSDWGPDIHPSCSNTTSQ